VKTACVIDASVAVKWFVPEIHSGHALRLLRKGFDLQAPELIQGVREYSLEEVSGGRSMEPPRGK
jgi:predicted nucleic acid-binding protein